MVREYLSPGFFDALEDDNERNNDNESTMRYWDDDEAGTPTPEGPSSVQSETMLVVVPSLQALDTPGPDSKNGSGMSYGSWFGGGCGCGGWKKLYNY